MRSHTKSEMAMLPCSLRLTAWTLADAHFFGDSRMKLKFIRIMIVSHEGWGEQKAESPGRWSVYFFDEGDILDSL